MKKCPIKVVVRLRPTANFAAQQMSVDEQSGQINIHTERALEAGVVNHQQNQWGFQFERVLNNASQEVVYNLAAKEVLTSALEGYSGCILCYGQTGAGKTFTMTGARSDYKYRGIAPRLISSLYQEINSRYEHQIKVSISYLQLYNETLLDLFDHQRTEGDKALGIQEDNKGYIVVKGLTRLPADNEEAALQLLFEGQNNRTVSQHKLNKASSRSHCIFTIHLQIRSKVQSSEKVVVSKINLVDLAGSQRTKKTGSQGKTLIQAQFINKSLSFLQQVVVALSDNKRDHIPYRQNKLTYLLKDSIGGNSKTSMIANIWPQSAHLQQTISTLKFASRMMKVSNEVSVQLNLDPSLLLKKYEKDIRDLKQQLAMHNTLANRGRISYEPYSAEQQHRQQLIAQEYLDGKVEDIQVDSLRQVKELFVQFRNLYKAGVRDSKRQTQPTHEKEEEHGKQELGEKKNVANRVGLEESNFGFGAGKAVKDSKPTRNISNLVNIPKDAFEEEIQNVPEVKKDAKINAKIVNVDKNQAYKEFKAGGGMEINNSILKNIQELKMQKENIKNKTQEAQKHKDKLDQLAALLKSKEENKNAEEITKNIIDEEEFQLIKLKKVCKRDYKLDIQKIKSMRNTIIELDNNLTALKTTMIQKFEEWFFKKYGISVADLQNPLLNASEKDEDAQAQHNVRPQDVDEDALAYIQAKRKVYLLQKARKNKI